MKQLLSAFFFLFISGVYATNPQQGSLATNIQFPLCVDGKSVGTLSLKAGSEITIVRIDPDGVLITIGEPTPVKVAKEAITSDSLSVASAQHTNAVTFGSGANQFTLDFTTIGNTNNNADPITGYGFVPYSFAMGTYTISQNQLQAAEKASGKDFGGGKSISDQPAVNVTWFQAAAFVNWLNESQGYAPAYNLSYSNGSYSMTLWKEDRAFTNGGTNFYRNRDCVFFLPNENEWYKSAYYDPKKNDGRGGYWQYPVGISYSPIAIASGTKAGTAVYDKVATTPAPVYTAGGFSPLGTMGQGGNVWQWIENTSSYKQRYPNDWRGLRGGAWDSPHDDLLSTCSPNVQVGNLSDDHCGFRVARILR